MILRSMALMTALNIAKAAAALLVSIVLARLVGPQEYGLVAFAIPLMSFIMLLTDLGIASAIVRAEELDERQAGSAVTLMGAAGLLSALAMTAAATPLERMLHMPGVGVVLLGFSVVTACSIWATVPRALIERRLEYPILSAVEAAGLLAALLIFVAGVHQGWGIRSLIAFHIVMQGVRAAAFTWLARARFKLGFPLVPIAPLLHVGGAVFATNLLAYFARNLDRLLIGGVLGAASLGLYGLAYQFMTIPLLLLSWPASGVLLSVLSRMRDETSAQRADVTCAVITATATLALPLMTFLVFGLDYPISAFYSARWEGLATLIALLAPAGAIQSIAVYSSSVLIARGRLRLNFLLGLLNGVGLCAVFCATVSHGLHTLVVAYMLGSLTTCTVQIHFMCRAGDISAAKFARCLVPGLAAAVTGVAAVAATTGLTPAHPATWLASAACYLAAAFAAIALQRAPLLDSLRILARTRPALAVQ